MPQDYLAAEWCAFSEGAHHSRLALCHNNAQKGPLLGGRLVNTCLTNIFSESKLGVFYLFSHMLMPQAYYNTPVSALPIKNTWYMNPLGINIWRWCILVTIWVERLKIISGSSHGAKTWAGLPLWYVVKEESGDKYQGAAFPHILQPLQNLRQARVIRVHEPYRWRRWIRFLETRGEQQQRDSRISTLTNMPALMSQE